MIEKEDLWGTTSHITKEIFLPDLSYPLTPHEESACALNVLDALDGFGDDDRALFREWLMIMNALGLSEVGPMDSVA